MAKTSTGRPTALEEQLEAITREFLGKIVSTIRNASFAEVAGYSAPAAGAPPKKAVTRVVATPSVSSSRAVERATDQNGSSRRPRQTADRRAELRDQLLGALQQAGGPMNARALATALGVPLDMLAAPIRELRDAGKITKHGDKRSTTYTTA
jgi:hypothetical protein